MEEGDDTAVKRLLSEAVEAFRVEVKTQGTHTYIACCYDPFKQVWRIGWLVLRFSSIYIVGRSSASIPASPPGSFQFLTFLGGVHG